MPLIPFTAGQDLTAQSLNDAIDIAGRLVYQVSDQTVTNSITPVSSNNLTLGVAANAVYIMEALIWYRASSVADFKHTFSLPSLAEMEFSQWGSETGAASVTSTIEHGRDVGTTYNSGGIGITMTMATRPTGRIATAGTAGSLTYQFSQVNLEASTATLVTGSWIRLTRVA